MDKFGIFELLDTLAQIVPTAKDGENTENETPASRVSPDDKAFLPPDFDSANSAEEQKTNRNAINSLYERHESISKRIDKNK